MEDYLQAWWKRAERPIRLPASEAERAREAERKNRRHLERELKKVGFDSIEQFEATAEDWGRRFPDMRG